MNKIALFILFSCAIVNIAWTVDAPLQPAKETLPATKINPIDGAEMVLVPAGEFLMGSTEEEVATWIKFHRNQKREWFISEIPQHKVYLDSYYMYKNEVTVAQFRKFCQDTKRKSMPPEPHWKWQDNDPVVNVTYNDVIAYAKWAEVSIPTEAQWEKAACGTDDKTFPWGNKWEPAKCVNEQNSNSSPKPVGSIPAGASPYGCLDMVGNVWEWCADWYSVDYYKKSPTNNPTGPVNGESRVIRGCSCLCLDDRTARNAYRDNFFPSDCFRDIGFRCAFPVK